MLEEQLLHLSRASKALTDDSCYLRVKNYYLWLSQTLQRNNKVNKSYTCSHCCQHWSDAKFSLRIAPNVSPGPRMSKILRKQEKCPDTLNSMERKLFIRYSKIKGNKMILNCDLCKLDTKIDLKNLIHFKKPEAPIEKHLTVEVKKIRKKKDHFAGLKASAVMSAASRSLLKSKVGKVTSKVKCHDSSGSASNQTVHVSSSLRPLNKTEPGVSGEFGLSHSGCSQGIDNRFGKGLHQKGDLSGVCLSIKDKMIMLRKKQKQNNQETKINAKIKRKKNDKLVSFLKTCDTKNESEDRIQSLLDY